MLRNFADFGFGKTTFAKGTLDAKLSDGSVAGAVITVVVQV